MSRTAQPSKALRFTSPGGAPPPAGRPDANLLRQTPCCVDEVLADAEAAAGTLNFLCGNPERSVRGTVRKITLPRRLVADLMMRRGCLRLVTRPSMSAACEPARRTPAGLGRETSSRPSVGRRNSRCARSTSNGRGTPLRNCTRVAMVACPARGRPGVSADKKVADPMK